MAFYENLVKLYQELIQGESSGLSQLQVDQVMSQLIGARQTLFNDKVTYRTGLDQFKMQLGMPPDTPIVMDQSFLGVPFYKVFDAVDDWQKRPDRNLDELPGIIGKIPAAPGHRHRWAVGPGHLPELSGRAQREQLRGRG